MTRGGRANLSRGIVDRVADFRAGLRLIIEEGLGTAYRVPEDMLDAILVLAPFMFSKPQGSDRRHWALKYELWAICWNWDRTLETQSLIKLPGSSAAEALYLALSRTHAPVLRGSSGASGFDSGLFLEAPPEPQRQPAMQGPELLLNLWALLSPGRVSVSTQAISQALTLLGRDSESGKNRLRIEAALNTLTTANCTVRTAETSYGGSPLLRPTQNGEFCADEWWSLPDSPFFVPARFLKLGSDYYSAIEITLELLISWRRHRFRREESLVRIARQLTSGLPENFDAERTLAILEKKGILHVGLTRPDTVTLHPPAWMSMPTVSHGGEGAKGPKHFPQERIRVLVRAVGGVEKFAKRFGTTRSFTKKLQDGTRNAPRKLIRAMAEDEDIVRLLADKVELA